MRQAILLMLHNNVEQSKHLISYFQGKCDVFIHIDKKLKVSENILLSVKAMPGVIGVYQQYKVHWGGFSILKTEMFLLEQALKYSDFRYVHLLSGTDYPIRPLSQFLDKFDNANSDYIEATHLPNPNWHFNTMYRLQYFLVIIYKFTLKCTFVLL